MATLSKGTTYSITSTVTSQSLHDLIEAAVLGSLLPTDISGAVKFLVTQFPTAPDPSLYPFWYDSNPVDPIFRVFAAPWNIWIAAGPHRFEMPLQNTTATMLAKGCMVIAGSGASQFGIGTNPSLNMIGFLQDTCASGAWGPIANCGVGWGLYCTNASTALNVLITPGLLLHGRGVRAGALQGQSPASAAGASGPYFGLCLDNARSGTTLGLGCARIQIWGPCHKGGGW